MVWIRLCPALCAGIDLNIVRLPQQFSSSKPLFEPNALTHSPCRKILRFPYGLQFGQLFSILFYFVFPSG